MNSAQKYQKLTTELLVALRGKRSRSMLSQRLGYSYNQVSRWESGRRYIDWVDFIELCKACKTDLTEAMKLAFRYHGSLDDQKSLLSFFALKDNLKGFSEVTEHSRYKVSRWMSGKQNIALAELLEVMNFCSTEFYLFLEKLVAIDALPSMAEDIKQLRHHEKSHFQMPGTSLVLSSLDLESYKELRAHDDDFIAKKTSLEISEVQEILKNLHQQGVIELAGNKYNTLRHQIRPHSSPEGLRSLLEFYQLRNAHFARTKFPLQSSLMGYLVFSLNSNQVHRLKERAAEFHNDICKIVNESQEGADQVYSFTMSLLNCEDLR